MKTKLAIASLLLAAGFSTNADEKLSFDRDLSLNASGLNEIFIDAGSGKMTVIGDDTDKITVTATIHSKKYDDLEELKEAFEYKMNFSLEQVGNKAVLKAMNKQSLFNFSNANIAIDLDVVFPKSMNLEIDDSSGSLTVSDVDGNVDVDDGSGSSQFKNLAQDLKIDDGSGSISIENVGGNVFIDDGSGSIKVDNIAGNITVDDGSGSVKITNLEGQFKLIDDGSGSVFVNGEKWNESKY